MPSLEEDAANELKALADRLRRVCVSSEVSLTEVRSCEDVRDRLRDLGLQSNTALYAISLPEADPKAVHQALADARAERFEGRAYSRLLPLQENPSRTIYVGSTRSLPTRLCQHLGTGPIRTSSLHMKAWWHEEFGPPTINIRAYAESTESDLLCIIEDHWAKKLYPLFGRRGSV